MTKPPKRTKSQKDPVPTVVRRPREERRALSPELEAFARGDDTALRRRRDVPKLRDPRAIALVAGVRNRDARLVCDMLVRRIHDALAAGDDMTLGTTLLDALRAEVWRGQSLTSFAALTENVLGIGEARARELAEAAAQRTNDACEPWTEEACAMWFRVRAALDELGLDGHVEIARQAAHGQRIRVDVPLRHAAAALAEIGKSAMVLAFDQARPPAPAHAPRSRER